MAVGELEGKVSLITGSSSGIGAECARALAAAGARVVVNSSSSIAAGEAVASELPGGAFYIQGDISDPSQCRNLVGSVVERCGRLDVLVNNAGWTTRVPHTDLEALTDEILLKTFEVNVHGTWWMSKAAMPALTESEGCIVNITSIAGLRPVGSSVAYGMAKAALNMLTIDLAKHFGPVRVNAVAPGLVATPWTSDWDDSHAAIAALVPAKRSATPEDCARAVMACVTNTYMTGAIVKVDGGTTLVL